MQGKIIKGIAGFYYVQTEDKLYECKAKGIFRNKKMKPLVGDNVEIDILDEAEQEGNITKIYERHNELIRPAVSNVDQALIIFAAKNPKPNYNLLDRFLMMMEKQDVPVIVCFNKVDLAKEKELKLLEKVYENCGHIVRFISVKEEEGIDEIRELIHGKTTVLAGPSHRSHNIHHLCSPSGTDTAPHCNTRNMDHPGHTSGQYKCRLPPSRCLHQTGNTGR